MKESKQEIMESTFEALCKHGYADLTIEKIAEESEKGKSNIYYHFDDKEALILEFLEFMREKLEEELSNLENESVEDELDEILDLMLGVEDEEMWDFQRALMEIRGRAQYNEKFKEQFREIDDLLKQEFGEVIQRTDTERPEIKVELLLSIIEGTLDRKITIGDREELEDIKFEIKRIIHNGGFS